MWTLVNSSTNMCRSDTGWFMVLNQQGQKLLSLKPSYLHPIGGLEDVWKTFPWSGVRMKNGSPNLPLFLTTFSRYENNFVISCQCLISQQTLPFESTFPSLSTGQVLISWQLYLRTNTKKITHISKLDIFSPGFSNRFGGKPTVHAWYDFLWVNHPRDGNPNLILSHWHCFQSWVRSILFVNFSSICRQVSMS